MVKRRKMGTAGGNQKSELQRETPILHSNSERLHLTAPVTMPQNDYPRGIRVA
jgi:hypothetical protein